MTLGVKQPKNHCDSGLGRFSPTQTPNATVKIRRQLWNRLRFLPRTPRKLPTCVAGCPRVGLAGKEWQLLSQPVGFHPSLKWLRGETGIRSRSGIGFPQGIAGSSPVGATIHSQNVNESHFCTPGQFVQRNVGYIPHLLWVCIRHHRLLKPLAGVLGAEPPGP